MDIVVPFGAKAFLTLPHAPVSLKNTFADAVFSEEGCEISLESGQYHMEYEPTVPMRKVFSINSSIGELLENEAAGKLVSEMLPFVAALPEQAYPASIPVIMKAMSMEIQEKQLQDLNEALGNIRG